MTEQRKEPVQVHCSECQRGGKGDKTCRAGWRVISKRGSNKFKMCFAGTKIGNEEEK